MEKISRCPTRICLFIVYQSVWMDTYMEYNEGGRNHSQLPRWVGGMLLPDSTGFDKSTINGILSIDHHATDFSDIFTT